jgi:hypothetical protein
MPFCLVVGRTSVSEEPTGSVADAGIFVLLFFVHCVCFCNYLMLVTVFFVAWLNIHVII